MKDEKIDPDSSGANSLVKGERRRLILTYAVLGPFIGGLLLALQSFLNPIPSWQLSSMPGLLFAVFTLTYFVGGIPAFIFGLIMTNFHRRIQSKFTYIAISALIGFLTSGIILGAILPFVILALHGAIAAGLIAYFSFRKPVGPHGRASQPAHPSLDAPSAFDP